MIKKQNNEENKSSERPRIKPPEIHRRPAAGGPAPRLGAFSTQTMQPIQARTPGFQNPRTAGGSGRPQRDGSPTSSSLKRSGGGRRPGREPSFRTRPAPRNPKMGPNPLAPQSPREKGNSEAVRFVPLGGLEEVGRNCMFLEYKNEIVIIDVGLQFPEEETPGIDYIIPNIQYLEKKKENIQAIILTHGHYDHIGALAAPRWQSSAIPRSTQPRSQKRSSKNARRISRIRRS